MRASTRWLASPRCGGARCGYGARGPDLDTPPRVAFAVGRGTGTAPERNRARRRLRAALRIASAELEPGRAYLLGAGREVVTMPFVELTAAVECLLRAAREQS